jgi:hypothetical protein
MDHPKINRRVTFTASAVVRDALLGLARSAVPGPLTANVNWSKCLMSQSAQPCFRGLVASSYRAGRPLGVRSRRRIR